MRDEGGSVLVEVMVSAIVITIAAIGVFSAFDAATRSTAQERHRAQAHGLAQAELARMRTMRISQLSPFLSEKRTLTVDGTPYAVHSDAEFVSAATGTDTCDEEGASADYIRIRSTVSWPSRGERPPVVAESLVAPPNSTAKAKSGALIVEVIDGAGEPMAGVLVTGTGPTPFSRETGANGCAVFGNLLAGNYEVTATVPGMVSPDGDESGSVGANVVAEATSLAQLEYSLPGSLKVNFVTRAASATSTPVPAKAQAFAVYHTRLIEARGFKATGAPESLLEAKSLFPFDDPYAVYAGACEASNPDPKGENPTDAIAEADIEAGKEATAQVEIPALRLEVYKGTTTSSGVVSGAKVTVEETNCSAAALPALKFETNAKGGLDEPGLPYSRRVGSSGGYKICVSGQSTSGKRKWTSSTNVSVPASSTDIAAGTSLKVFLRDGSTTSSDCW